jgi:succinyl-diaminopimelate desuccinylase
MVPTKDIIGKVLKQIDPDALISLTADLVRINSVWDPVAGTSEQPAAEYIFKWAKAKGFEVQLEEVAPRRSMWSLRGMCRPGNTIPSALR